MFSYNKNIDRLETFQCDEFSVKAVKAPTHYYVLSEIFYLIVSIYRKTKTGKLNLNKKFDM
jgi:hypothetical protein